MNFPALVTLLFLYVVCISSPAVAKDDIFATPASTPTMKDRYPTAAAFLAATRSGEIPEMLHDKTQNATWLKVGPPLLNILTKEYGLDIKDYYGSDEMFGLMLKNITDHEFDTDDKAPVAAFQGNQKQMREAGRNAFNKFAVQYDQALKEYIASKHQHEEQRQKDLAEQQRLENLKAKQSEEERRKQKELADARQASQRAEQDIRDAAMKDALKKAQEARKQKLAEIVASPAYQLWEAALQVQQGEEMISNAQRVLDHDDEVRRASGVTDLAARRAAGEQMVAGKTLVETAFAAYKKLGGKAITPSEVVAGPDPAADYR